MDPCWAEFSKFSHPKFHDFTIQFPAMSYLYSMICSLSVLIPVLPLKIRPVRVSTSAFRCKKRHSLQVVVIGFQNPTCSTSPFLSDFFLFLQVSCSSSENGGLSRRVSYGLHQAYNSIPLRRLGRHKRYYGHSLGLNIRIVTLHTFHETSRY